jgi:hypothetical protein
MIKKYKEFIKSLNESHDSIGEWIESLIEDDYIKMIVNRYTGDIDPSIRMSNSINILDKKIQSEIKTQVDRYLEEGIVDKEPEVITSTDTNILLEMVQEEISVAGKGIFSSFLKSLTALGQKESKPNWEECPDDYLIYYKFDLLAEDVKQVFSRFKSLIRYEQLIDWGKNETTLYFGIKCNGQFEYGVSYDRLLPIGQFKLSKSTINWILKLESKSAKSIKKEIVNLSYSDIITLGRIKMDMMDYNPGYSEKRAYPVITEGVISFGYYGLGKWENGKIDEIELTKIKENFTKWVISKKWGGKILVSVKPQSFWTWFNIKIK